MPKVVLLPIGGSAADADVFAAARLLGHAESCHFVALHVRPDVRSDIGALASSDGGMMSGIDAMIDRMETEADARERRASESWRAFCEENAIVLSDTPARGGLTSEWASETGVEADWVAEYGRTADLIVAGRGAQALGPDLSLMEAALMDTGKPVLIPRTGGMAAGFETVGIAWKDTREAAGAVHAAQPFIAAAAQVVIFTVAEADDGDKSHLRLARMLRWHNRNVSIQALKPGSAAPAGTLLAAAAKANCGLLVMGAYGHTRLREAVFGGFTRAVLEAAPLPVLMAH